MQVDHFILPDTQLMPGSITAHLDWISKEIVELQPKKIVHLGDHWDFPSLSDWAKGTIEAEGLRFSSDVAAGNYGLKKLERRVNELNKARKKSRKKLYRPKKYLLRGNHENRMVRAVKNNPHLKGTITERAFNDRLLGWQPVPFLKPLELDGITYCHYFCRNADGQVVQSKRGQSNARVQVVREGRTCTAGHQQGLSFHPLQRQDRIDYGLIAGSCYLDEFSYLTEQGTQYWRGIVLKRNVRDGQYSPQFVSLDELCRKYEGRSLKSFMSDPRTNKHVITDDLLEDYYV